MLKRAILAYSLSRSVNWVMGGARMLLCSLRVGRELFDQGLSIAYNPPISLTTAGALQLIQHPSKPSSGTASNRNQAASHGGIHRRYLPFKAHAALARAKFRAAVVVSSDLLKIGYNEVEAT